VGIIFSLASVNFDYLIFTHPSITIRLSSLLTVVLAFQTARLIDWLISKVLITNYYEIRGKQKQSIQENRYAQKAEKTADRTVQYIVYVAAILLTIQIFHINFRFGDLFDDTVTTTQTDTPPAANDTIDANDDANSGEKIIRNFRLNNFFIALLILLAARLGAWIIINLVLYNYYKRRRINIGSQYAINQLLKYFIYVIALLIALESLGVKLTVLWGGAAALLVGVGLGLQQTFNDLISGIILLFERTVEVGDFVQMDGLIGTVKRIGLRTSLVETRENITVIVPNSKLIVDNVINWSHYDNKARFVVAVGVAYGSDTQLVKKILLEVVKQNGHVLKYPTPIVRFTDFGDSSLNFEVLFWSNDFNRIEDIKSDIRFEIDHEFRKANVEIPFPQRDIWIRSSNSEGEGL
jgi:small-conductance mechanosensitive channel